MQQTGTIADVKPDVLGALQNRTDVSDADIARYVSRAATELTESYPFPELQTTGPQFNLSIGQAIYPITNFLNVGDEYSMPESFAIFIDFPTNSVVAPLRFKTPAALETITAPAVQGIPAWFTRFGSNFHFGPVPTATFTVFLRYQVKHPFDNHFATQLGDPLYLPVSWYDILGYAAAMRIAIVKRWTDQRKELHDLLYGDPEFQMSDGRRGRPGLIAARLFQQERDQAYNSRSMTPVVARVNPR